MQRDYILRLIEQLGEFLSRITQQRERHAPQEALQSVMAACERLFGLEAVQIFQFTPDQHVAMLTDGEPPENARDKVLMYAALNLEAGRCYTTLNQPKLAQQSFLNALRLTLQARQKFTAANWPTFAPNITDLLALLGDTPLDASTAELLAASDRAP
ncbi:MAG TPA: hypothetical protein VEA63_09340 [Opitutus sp.]|nr:hypothetical protein [Opitutus sp.]